MPASTCEARIRSRDGAAVIELSGDIDGDARDVFQGIYDSAAGDRLVLDFTRVDYINSTGIALIVGLLARARGDDRAVAAYGLSEHYREIFAITRLTDYVRVTADEASALADATPTTS